LLKPKGSIYTRQYATALVTRCTLSLNDGEGSWAGLCQCGSFVMFCAPNARIMKKNILPKNQVRSTLSLTVEIHFQLSLRWSVRWKYEIKKYVLSITHALCVR